MENEGGGIQKKSRVHSTCGGVGYHGGRGRAVKVGKDKRPCVEGKAIDVTKEGHTVQ